MHWEADLDGGVWPGLSVINYPKAEYADEIRRLDRGSASWSGCAASAGHDRDPGLDRDGPRGDERLRDRHRQPARADLRRRWDGFDVCRDLAIETLPGRPARRRTTTASARPA